MENKGRHGTDPWPTPLCLDIFPTPQRLQNMPFIAYSGARPLAGLGHICSREMISHSDPEWWRDDHGPTNVGAMVKIWMVAFQPKKSVNPPQTFLNRN